MHIFSAFFLKRKNTEKKTQRHTKKRQLESLSGNIAPKSIIKQCYIFHRTVKEKKNLSDKKENTKFCCPEKKTNDTTASNSVTWCSKELMRHRVFLLRYFSSFKRFLLRQDARITFDEICLLLQQRRSFIECSPQIGSVYSLSIRGSDFHVSNHFSRTSN